MVDITLRVNGATRTGSPEARKTLADFLRDDLDLTGTHVGCEHGVCGACTVIVDGRPVRSCLMLAVQAAGSEVTTIEGLATDGGLGTLQQAMWDSHGFQCGFCTPGFVMSATAFLSDHPDAGEQQLREALSGNICRCTGYQSIINGVLLAAERNRREPVSEGATMTAIAAERYTGASIKRSEDPRILTGAGRYVDDIKLPGHAARRVRPVAAGSRSRALGRCLGRAGAARSGRGAHRSGPGSDNGPGAGSAAGSFRTGGPTPEFTLLATDKVRFVGDPVAVVIAESRYLAEDGCELVEVEYDDLPPVVTAAFALDPASPPLFANLGDNIARPHSRNEFGDVAGTFAKADRVIDFHIDVHRHQNVPMEGRGCVASWDAGEGVMTVHAATQSVHITRNGVAARLGLEGDKVRVLAGDIGGSFGLKIGASREELAVAAASRQLGRPVKWVEDRGENLTASGQAREESFDVRAAVSNDGDLLGLDVKMVIDTGAYPGMGTMVPDIMQAMLPGPYKLAALGFESTAAITNKASYVAYRGPWASETFVRERVLDLIAKDLGLDPVEIRLRNVAPRTDPPASMITGRPLVGVTTKRVTGAGRPAGGLPRVPAPAGRGPSAGPLPRHRGGDVHRSRSGPRSRRGRRRPGH